jgi:membrane-associated phospholipid phosphatase
LVLRLTHQSPIFIHCCLAAIGLISGGWFLNRWLKPSMHVGFASLVGASLLSTNAMVGILVILFAALIGWSRVVLERHTTTEVYVGLFLGMAAALLTQSS